MKENKQKIEWYKEVLALEPGSRIFFPLARLQTEEGQIVAAVNTLQQGLSKHPDHVEARLMLVELLFKHTGTDEIQGEVDNLGRLFASYPNFWLAWSARLASVPAMQDASLAMRFFSAALQGKRIGWGDVIAQGIRSLFGESAGADDVTIKTVQSTSEDDDLGEPLVTQKRIEAALSSSYPEESVEVTPLHAADSHGLHTRYAEADDKIPTAAPQTKPEAPAGSSRGREAFSLRTRSMAEVLAEQGDMASAIDIYQELMQTASAEEQQIFTDRIEELARLAAESPAVVRHEADDYEEEDEDDSEAPTVESTRLVSLLESLAQRLEDRVR